MSLCRLPSHEGSGLKYKLTDTIKNIDKVSPRMRGVD